MKNKFEVKDNFISVVLPEEHVEYIRSEWEKQTGDYNICVLPFSTDKQNITHWVCMQSGTTLEFVKIQIFFKKRNVDLLKDENFGYFLKWHDSVGYLMEDYERMPILFNTVKRMGITRVAEEDKQFKMKSYISMIEHKEFIKTALKG